MARITGPLPSRQRVPRRAPTPAVVPQISIPASGCGCALPPDRRPHPDYIRSDTFILFQPGVTTRVPRPCLADLGSQGRPRRAGRVGAVPPPESSAQSNEEETLDPYWAGCDDSRHTTVHGWPLRMQPQTSTIRGVASLPNKFATILAPKAVHTKCCVQFLNLRTLTPGKFPEMLLNLIKLPIDRNSSRLPELRPRNTVTYEVAYLILLLFNLYFLVANEVFFAFLTPKLALFRRCA